VIEGERIDSEKVRALFETGNFLLLYEAEQLVGCVYVEVKGKRGYLGLLGVRPERQKSGFGRRLTTAAEDIFVKLAVKRWIFASSVYVASSRRFMNGLDMPPPQ